MSEVPHTSQVTLPVTSLWANRKCLIIACIVATANTQYGFDSAAIGALQAMPGFLKVFGFEDPNSPVGYGIDSTFQQLIGSLLTLGAFLSSILAGTFGAFYGRKTALWLACALNCVGLAIQIGTTNKGVVYLGRIVLGFSNGFLVTFSNIYTAEIAPAHLRGVMVALFAYWVNIGAILGTIVDNYTKDRLDKGSYQIPIGSLYIVPVLLAIGLFFVPETPRWLLHHNRESQARKSLETLRADSLAPEYFELEWAEIIRGVEEERKTAKSVGLLDMFRGADLRRTLLCWGTIMTQAGSGSWFPIAYQTYFFQIAGIKQAFEYSIMITCIGFVGVNCGMYAMRHLVGRRFICIFGSIVTSLCFLGMAIAQSASPGTMTTGKVTVAMVAIWGFFYNGIRGPSLFRVPCSHLLGCVGAATYPVATELVSSRLRAWTVGSATSLQYVFAWLTSFCTPYFINPGDLNWVSLTHSSPECEAANAWFQGPKYGYIWFGSNIACAIFYFFCIPEVRIGPELNMDFANQNQLKGRSLEEIDELFEKRVGVFKFKTYRTEIQEKALHDVQANTGAFLEKQPAISHVEVEQSEAKTA
ncbi:putative sugar transporter [Cladophialophora carrionii]|uniref:Putative sugar transporter n=1 Tax=Cladophialophora carrionii TaxID=86049 RepID=A0A1C1C8M1_9EURO|nr:putative sugar transporter [Cladophialophora carrionii]